MLRIISHSIKGVNADTTPRSCDKRWSIWWGTRNVNSRISRNCPRCSTIARVPQCDVQHQHNLIGWLDLRIVCMKGNELIRCWRAPQLEKIHRASLPNSVYFELFWGIETGSVETRYQEASLHLAAPVDLSETTDTKIDRGEEIREFLEIMYRLVKDLKVVFMVVQRDAIWLPHVLFSALYLSLLYLSQYTRHLPCNTQHFSVSRKPLHLFFSRPRYVHSTACEDPF